MDSMMAVRNPFLNRSKVKSNNTSVNNLTTLNTNNILQEQP